MIVSQTSAFGGYYFIQAGSNIITGGTSDSAGVFTVKSIPRGSYTVDITAIGYRTATLAPVVISADTLLPAISFPGPCKYVYAKGLPIACVGGHTDHIVPLMYGLPGKRLMKKAAQGKVHLAGCQRTDCDPHYYCLIHNKEL